MVSKGILWLLVARGPSFAILGQTASWDVSQNVPQNLPMIAPIPSDPFEIVTGPIQAVDTPAGRETIVDLLARARKSFALRSPSHGFDLKVTFRVNSGGETEYDGAWQMEDIFDPEQGLRWTAKAASGYTTTQIYSTEMFYGEGTASTFPLRLHEARAALFGPVAPPGAVDRDLMRTSTATFHGAQVTCVLLSAPGNAATDTHGRRWEETEDCIDPQSGLLQVHSQAPGRYYAYDYSNASQLDGHTLPRKVIVTEAGRTVTEISVDSLREIPSADPSLFIPTEAMRARGPVVAMTDSQKISRFVGQSSFSSGATAKPVCVFGLVTASGKLVEAHSLQPSDPNSRAAVQAAKRINFAHPTRLGTRPEQHFVFVIEKFVSSQ